MKFYQELPRSTKFLLVWCASTVLSLPPILVSGSPILLVLIWLPLVFGAPLVVLTLANKCWMLKIICWFKKDHHVIKCIDIQKDCYYTIASANAQGIWTAPVYWFNETGQLILCPNGVVDPLCPSSYVYFWEFVDQEKKAIMHLQWPEFRSIADYLKMDDDKFWDEHIRAIDSLT